MFELDVTKENPWISVVLSAGAAYVTYYLLCVGKRPLLACNDRFRNFMYCYMPVVRSKFWPTFWCIQTHAQTILRSLYKSIPTINYEKEILTLSDGGVIAVDWMENEESHHRDSGTRPTVLILPGLTGSSEDSYALHFVRQATGLGYRSVVFNYRGNGGVELKTPRTYNATNTEDLSFVVNHIKGRFPNAPLVAVGVSLGGIILTNYLAKTGRDGGFVAAMTVSAAWNVFESAKTLEAPINKYLFNRLLALNLVDNVRKYEHLFQQQEKYDMDHIFQSRTIREFDDRFTSLQFGYQTYEEYYMDACTHTKIDLIQVPLLCLNAADDPFSPSHAIPTSEAKKSRYVSIIVTSHGGHIGFLEGLNPRHESYMDRVFGQYINAIFKHGDELMKVL